MALQNKSLVLIAISIVLLNGCHSDKAQSNSETTTAKPTVNVDHQNQIALQVPTVVARTTKRTVFFGNPMALATLFWEM